MPRKRMTDTEARTFYVTTFCNFPHRVSDGMPIGHECYVLPPKALKAEMEGDFDLAIELLRLRSGRTSRGTRRRS